MGVEGLSAKVLQGRLGGFRQQGRLAAESGPINVIAEEGVAYRGQMHPNLVRAAGFQRARQQTCGRIGLSASFPGPFRLSKPLQELPIRQPRPIGKKGGPTPAMVAGLVIGSPEFQRR